MTEQAHSSNNFLRREAYPAYLPLTNALGFHLARDCGDQPGHPMRAQFEEIIADYLSNLSNRKTNKALIDQEMYNTIHYTLQHPADVTIRDPQFRFWARKMFTLQRLPSHIAGEAVFVVTHHDRPVAIKEELYAILCHCHSLCRHSGRDKTLVEVKKLYSYIPRHIVAAFVKNCPTCAYRRNAQDARLADTDNGTTGSASYFRRRSIDRAGTSEDDFMDIDKGEIPSQDRTASNAVSSHGNHNQPAMIHAAQRLEHGGRARSYPPSNSRISTQRMERTMEMSATPPMRTRSARTAGGQPVNRAEPHQTRLSSHRTLLIPIPVSCTPSNTTTTLPSFAEFVRGIDLSPVDSSDQRISYPYWTKPQQMSYGMNSYPQRPDDGQAPGGAGRGDLRDDVASDRLFVSISSGHLASEPRQIDLSSIGAQRRGGMGSSSFSVTSSMAEGHARTSRDLAWKTGVHREERTEGQTGLIGEGDRSDHRSCTGRWFTRARG